MRGTEPTSKACPRRRGLAIVWVTIIFTILMAMGSLAVDYGRVQTAKTELLMFLTPHIVDAPSQLAGMSSTEWHQTQLFTNSVSEEELDRFLERVPAKKSKSKAK